MKPIGTRELHTERLVLRAPSPSDASALVSAGSLLMDVPQAEAALKGMAEEAAKPFGFHWVITLDGLAIGRVKGWEVKPYDGYVQLGYDVSPAYRRKGIMTEAVAAVIRYLIFDAGANRVYCSVREGNLASRRVCEKNGMRLEGTLRQHYGRPDGGYDNVCIYGVIRADMMEE